MGTAEPTQNSILDQPRARTTAPAVSVLVVDVGVWLRARLWRLLETEPRFRVAGLADSAEEAMWIAEHEPVDLAVIGHHPRSPQRIVVVPRSSSGARRLPGS